MQVRAWVCNALSGEKQAEIDLTEWSGSHRLDHKGQFDGAVSLNLTTLDGSTPDYPSIRRMHSLMRPMLNTIVLTGTQMVPASPWRGVPHTLDLIPNPTSKRVLGEWFLASAQPRSDQPTLQVGGHPWEAYPTFLAQDMTMKRTGINAGTLAREILTHVYSGVQMTIPTVTAGYNVDMDRPVLSGKWAEAIDEVCRQAPGLEWVVDVIPVWDGEDLAGVTRQVRWGAPTIRRPSNIVLEAPEPKTTQGNAVIMGGGLDGTRYNATVYGVGSGEGAKQLTANASNTGLSAHGYLNASSVASFPDVTSQGNLNRLTQQALAESQGTLNGALSLPRDPWTVEALVDYLPVRPLLGDVVRLLHRMSWGYPGIAGAAAEGGMAIDEQVRIGEIHYRHVDNAPTVLERVTIKAV